MVQKIQGSKMLVSHSGSWSVVHHLEFKMAVIFNPGYGYAKNQFEQIWSNYALLENQFHANQL